MIGRKRKLKMNTEKGIDINISFNKDLCFLNFKKVTTVEVRSALQG